MYTCHVPPFRFNVSFTDSNVNIYQLKADSKFLLFLLFLRHIFFCALVESRWLLTYSPQFYCFVNTMNIQKHKQEGIIQQASSDCASAINNSTNNCHLRNLGFKDLHGFLMYIFVITVLSNVHNYNAGLSHLDNQTVFAFRK